MKNPMNKTAYACLRPFRLSCLAPALILLSSHAQGVVVFTDDFESPVVATAYTVANTSQQIDSSKWVQSNEGFGSGSRGIVVRDLETGTSAPYFTAPPTGSQAWAGRSRTNTGLTSAFQQIGTLTVGQTISVTFSATQDFWRTTDNTNTGGNAQNGTAFDVALVLFDGAGTRNDVRNSLTGTTAVLGRLLGDTFGVDDTWQTFSFSYTVGDAVVDNNGAAAGADTTWDAGLLGQDIAIRFGQSHNTIIDNVSVSIIPEPTTALLGALGLLALLRRRR